MFASVVIGVAIFGYSGWALWKFISRSKQGKCASCSVSKSCESKACSSPVQELNK